MKHLEILKTPVEPGLNNYKMAGEPIINRISKIKDIPGIFQNEKSYIEMDQKQLADTVKAWLPVADGTKGGLFFGTSTIYSGKVGNEYFILN